MESVAAAQAQLDELNAKIRLARSELAEIGNHKIRLDSQVAETEAYLRKVKADIKRQQQQLTRDQNAVRDVNPGLRADSNAFLDLS